MFVRTKILLGGVGVEQFLYLVCGLGMEYNRTPRSPASALKA